MANERCLLKGAILFYYIYIALISFVVLLRDCSFCFVTVIHYTQRVNYNFCTTSIRFLISPELPL